MISLTSQSANMYHVVCCTTRTNGNKRANQTLFSRSLCACVCVSLSLCPSLCSLFQQQRNNDNVTTNDTDSPIWTNMPLVPDVLQKMDMSSSSSSAVPLSLPSSRQRQRQQHRQRAFPHSFRIIVPTAISTLLLILTLDLAYCWTTKSVMRLQRVIRQK